MTPPKARVKRKYGPRSQYTCVVSMRRRLRTGGESDGGRTYRGPLIPRQSQEVVGRPALSSVVDRRGRVWSGARADERGCLPIRLVVDHGDLAGYALAGAPVVRHRGARGCCSGGGWESRVSRQPSQGPGSLRAVEYRIRAVGDARGLGAQARTGAALLRVGRTGHVAARRRLGSHAPAAAVVGKQQEMVVAVEGEGRTTAWGRVPRPR